MAIKRGPFKRDFPKIRAVRVIQKFVRMFLAKCKLTKLKKQKSMRERQLKQQNNQIAALLPSGSKPFSAKKDNEVITGRKPAYNPSKTAGNTTANNSSSNPFPANKQQQTQLAKKGSDVVRRLSMKGSSHSINNPPPQIMRARDILKQVPEPLVLPLDILRQQEKIKKNEMLLKIYINPSKNKKESTNERVMLPTLYEEKKPQQTLQASNSQLSDNKKKAFGFLKI
jgi:hypothetical protein